MDLLELERDISVNGVLIENIENPLSDERYYEIEKYYLALKKAGLIDLIGAYHYYDKNTFNFYFNIFDASKSRSKRLVFNKNITDLILKHKIINYIVIKHHEYFSIP